MDTNEILLWCFQQNYHLDKSNAAIHCAPVRFSPVTFRILERMLELWPDYEDITQEMTEVRSHIRLYEEDKGR